jgi:copper ion binding protein
MTTILSVPEISCQHCVNAITKEVSRLRGVRNVQVDLATKRVSVDANEQVSPAQLVEAINEAGYDDVAVLS